ncbi:iron-siderophore ABC transporter substrate-binding protein [Chitinibacter sp. GC72]|uniref:iron-siderophore ABC transporter substrate-binding protein n=1 Tax=Chitinibacter sp. GC72 TaxID=1526917 RepID=UPI0012FBF1CD|nr:iron-siderophore ABC transporter substrate-binding protein [Chitinibacter sp. GC72]
MKIIVVVLGLLLSSLLQAAPSRVIALSWEATEYLLTLGVTPIAVADRADYQQWVVEPALPGKVLDAGSRLEPNLERIYALKPDLIIINPALAGMQANLEKIAPTLLLDAFRAEHDNASAAERLQRQLAVRLDRLAQHEAFVRQQGLELAKLRQIIGQRFGAKPPAVCLIRFASPVSFWVYGENSLPEAAMHALGLRNACPQQRTAWGTRLRKLPDLAALNEGLLLHIAPFPRQTELERSRLWQALPVVRERRVYAMPPVWTNGGMYSISRLARQISAQLQNRSPD